MIGVYDYTVILTYLSAISACIGVMVSLSNTGHPYLGVFFLLICGLCDAFDGKVASTKKNRTDSMKKFGIQIDSLSDLVAFGVLPATIGNAMIRVSPKFSGILTKDSPKFNLVTAIFLFGILIIYFLAALIRLAYYNVSEEERQNTETGSRKIYEGLPVTSAALIFPTVLLIQYLTEMDVTIVFFIVMAMMAVAFVSRIRIPKPGLKVILGLVALGIAEFIILIIFGLN